MPNGFQGSKEDWEKLDGPLKALDPFLEAYAQKHGFELTKYYHNWPERTLQIKKKELEKKIQIYLEDAKKTCYKIWVVVAQDKWTPEEGLKSYWKKVTIKSNITPPITEEDLRIWLDEARNFIAKVKKSDLVET